MALDSTPLQARGTPWHQSQRRKGICPDTRVDPEAHWCASGWHGWTFAIKRQNILTACPLLCVWLPLAAQATPGNVANSTHAPHLLDDLAPLEGSGGLILAESVYQDPEVRACCTRDGRTLVASRKGLHL